MLNRLAQKDTAGFVLGLGAGMLAVAPTGYAFLIGTGLTLVGITLFVLAHERPAQ